MARVGILPVFLRESLVKRTLPREPEPDLVMDDPGQVAAFTEAGRIDGVMAASYLFNSARVSQVIHGCVRVIDLGCGPATQLAQIAELNPETSFLGVELSTGMLEQARQHVDRLGLKNVELVHGDMTNIGQVASGSADGVISTMALHHLPTHSHLERCFAEIRRVLKPGGAVYLLDLGRLKSLKSVLYFAYMNARHQPHTFSLDYERSLRAAFLREDFERLTAGRLGPGYTTYSTFPIPVLLLVKSGDRTSRNAALTERLAQLRDRLPWRYRQDLSLIRRLFRLGGLSNDPFH